MSISHQRIRRRIGLLGSILLFSTCFSAPDAVLSCQQVRQMNCCSATATGPCVRTTCCQTSPPKQLPLPLDPWKISDSAGLKNFVAAIAIPHAVTDEGAPARPDLDALIRPPTQSLIAQHIRLQI